MSFRVPFHALFSAKYKVRTVFQKRLMISGNLRVEIGMEIGSKSKQVLDPLRSLLSLEP